MCYEKLINMNNETIVKTKNIAKEFALATQRRDIKGMGSLLSSKGAFQIRDEKNETIEVNKKEFLKWYGAKLENTTITDIAYDQCLLCAIGNTVILFNNGKFLRIIKEDSDLSEKSKVGLMLEIKEEKISHIKFCFTFLKTENKIVIECIGRKVGKYIEQGFSTSDAIKMARIDEDL